MNIIIYNINSFGGNYEYAKYLFKAYKQNKKVHNCKLLMPSNAGIEGEGVSKILIKDLVESDSKWLKRIHFLWRSLINPYRLFLYLIQQSPSIIIFNDFDQVTSWLWAPAFYLLKKRHRFAVILHDPDRDQFFPNKSLSGSSMRIIMGFMDFAFSHGFLPDKSYYKGPFQKIKVPHGIYDDGRVDDQVLKGLQEKKGADFLLGVLGNVREEKNYEAVIDVLPELENVKLLIAGKTANSGVDINYYKNYASERQVSHKIIWLIEYLDLPAFNAAIQCCDLVLLYYKPSFTSQSGILNSIAPFKKKLIISDIESSLKESVEKYSLGKIVSFNDPVNLRLAISHFVDIPSKHYEAGWNQYLEESSWEAHVRIAMDTFQ